MFSLLFNQLTYSHIPVKNEDGSLFRMYYLKMMHIVSKHEKNIARLYIYAIEGFFVRPYN